MKISSGSVGINKFQPTFQKKKVSHPQIENPINDSRKTKIKKTIPFALAVSFGVIGLGVGLLAGSKNASKISNSIGKITKKEMPLGEKAMLALIALAGFGGYTKGEIDRKDLEEKLDLIIENKSPNQKAIKSQGGDIIEIKRTQTNSSIKKHAQYFHDVLLLKEDNALNRNGKLYAQAIETIENIGLEKLTSTKPLPEITKSLPVVWSITSEFAPIKEGGLGSVPPEVRNNSEKLGVNMPTFMPMYLNNGNSSLIKKENEYYYAYKGKEMPLSLVATVKMDVYKNGKSQTIPVNYFLHTDKDKHGNERQLILIHADNYFDGTIYEANSKTEEPEKFAVMSKAVYEFAKLKMDGAKASKNIEIHSTLAFNKIKTPDAMILNDWQASPTAALLRYKAVMENAYGQISNETAQKLKDMSVITIGHNVMYQGSSQSNNDYFQKKATTSNILNTLFDKYTYDIVTHAKSGASTIDPKDAGLKALDNVLLMDYENDAENYTNFLNMGIILSDYFDPVSKNYAKELIDVKRNDLSYMLQWALVQKDKAGKLIGVINGNDYDNLNIESKAPGIKKGTGIDFKTYSKNDPTRTIQKRRLSNKINFYKNFILPFSESSTSEDYLVKDVKKLTSAIEFVAGKQGTTLPMLDEYEIENTPILMSGGRLVSQKGIDILCEAIQILFDNWDKDFKDKNKPIFYIAGGDGEGGTQRKIIEQTKEKLSKEDNNRILFAHGRVPMAGFMSASDYFLMPSKFEPCGLTQGESLALATPVIASAVGGIVDTINRNGKFNGILTNKNEMLSAQAYYEAIKEGLKIFYDDKEKYSKMVRDSIDEDFSWAKEGRQGPVYDYLDLLGIKREGLPNILN